MNDAKMLRVSIQMAMSFSDRDANLCRSRYDLEWSVLLLAVPGHIWRRTTLSEGRSARFLLDSSGRLSKAREADQVNIHAMDMFIYRNLRISIYLPDGYATIYLLI